jgi:aryl-alcohol dehydrogenase-like predicted oxidoreductase
MDYVRLGNTGLEVSKLCLGCMSYGDPARGGHPWSLPEDQSVPFLEKALDAGVNFFDTANVYSNGSSEEILGSVLLKKVRRDEVVIASKVCGQMRPGPNGHGLSRKAILAEIDNSLRHADRRDAASVARCGRGGQGALPRRLVDVVLAVRQGAVPAGAARLAPVREHAEPLQPALP